MKIILSHQEVNDILKEGLPIGPRDTQGIRQPQTIKFMQKQISGGDLEVYFDYVEVSL